MNTAIDDGEKMNFDDVGAPLDFDAIGAPLTEADVLPEPEHVQAADIIQPDQVNGDDGEHDPIVNELVHNPHFRCLGYLNNANYFMSLNSGQIFEMKASDMKANLLMHLAPRDWWREQFGKRNGEGALTGVVNWESAVDILVQGSYRAGVWDPRMQCVQGARLDEGVVVFNTGSKLHVQGRGMGPLQSFEGRYSYCIGPKTRTPDVTAPFPADSRDTRKLLDLIRSLDWRPERRELSIMALFGWVAISPICGILKWRPHVWLDGPRGSGKSWVVNNLLKPVLGDYVVNVLSNSSESGIRNLLNARSIPVLFDEAEGEDRDSRSRMDAIIRLARHSATESDSVVAQGVSGGGHARFHSIASTFLMTSIVPQLEAAADQSRFARLLLASGRKHESFSRDIEIPASELLTQEFSDRWIGRMITRAPDYHRTYLHMVHGLCQLGLERRIADVYGSFATGCWLMLMDGVPANENEASQFIANEFNVIPQLKDFNDELTEDKDHNRLFSALMAYDVRLDGRNGGGTRSEQLGVIMEVACGYVNPNTDVMLSMEEARAILTRHGMRPGVDERTAVDDEKATHLLIHKNSTIIRAILEKTPYARSYPDVMHQAEDVKMGKPVRFGAGHGTSRSIIVPLKHFSIGVEG